MYVCTDAVPKLCDSEHANDGDWSGSSTWHPENGTACVVVDVNLLEN